MKWAYILLKRADVQSELRKEANEMSNNDRTCPLEESLMVIGLSQQATHSLTTDVHPSIIHERRFDGHR